MSYLSNIQTTSRSMNGIISLSDGVNTFSDGEITFADAGSVLDSTAGIVTTPADNTPFTGVNTFDNLTDATSLRVVALVVSGGASIGERLQVGGVVTCGKSLNAGATTLSSATVTGALSAGATTLSSATVTNEFSAGAATLSSATVTNALSAGATTLSSASNGNKCIEFSDSTKREYSTETCKSIAH